MRYNPVKTKMSGLVITTVLLIILSLCLFLFVVISNNEKEIISRSFRVLSQIGENIKAKDKTNFKVTANKWHFKGNTKSNIPVDNIERTIEGNSFSYKVNPNTNKDLITPINLKDTKTVVNVADLVNSLLRKDVFDEFIIREGEGAEEDKRILFNSLGVDIRLNKGEKKDTLIWEAGKMSTVEIGAVEYKSFTLPLEIGDSEWWYLDGLIANDKFVQEKRGLDTWFITLMILLLVFIVLSFPVARLFLMSWLEHIQRNSLILISFSVCFGVSLSILLLLALTSNHQLENEREDQLKAFANSIEKKFIAEIDSIYKQIQNYDTLTTPIEFVNTVLLKSDSLHKFYPYYKSSFWMDSSGNQVQEFNTRQLNKKLVNLAHRNYFQHKDGWLLPSANKGDDSSRFMLESIYSVTTGEALAAISKRSIGSKLFKTGTEEKSIKEFNPSVIALSTPMHSVMDPVLPKGFVYSIIDKKGNILFHSNKKRNLQENFLGESNNNKKLQSAIFSKTDEIIYLKYQNKKSIIYIKPVKNIPLFIITSQDKELINFLNSQVIASSLLFTILGFIFIGFHILLFMITNFRKSELKEKEFAIEWLLPRKSEIGKYAELSLINFIIIMLLAVVHFIPTGLNYNLIDSFFLFLYSQIILMELARQELKFNVNRITVDTFLIITLIFLLLINYLHASISNDYYCYLFFQIGILVLFIAFRRFLILKQLKKIVVNKFLDRNYLKIYQNFLLSWLLLIGVLPSIIFYNNASQFEKRVGIKYQQLHIARELQARNKVIDKYYTENNINDTNDNLYKNRRKHKGIYTNFYLGTTIYENASKHSKNVPDSINLVTSLKDSVTITASFKDSVKHSENVKDSIRRIAYYSKKDSLLTLLLLEKPLFNRQAIEKRKLAFNAASDTSWLWEEKGDSLLCLDFVLNDIQKKDSVVSKNISLNTQLPDLTFNGFGNFPVIFWLLFIVVLISVNGLLKLILKRIFPFLTGKGLSNLTFMDIIEKSQQSALFTSRVFAVKLSGESDGKMKINIRQKGFKCVDISTDPDFKNWMIKCGQIVLLNLDESINDLDLFKKKNDLLGKITRLNKQQVIISSRRSPKQIIDYYTSIKEQDGVDRNIIEQEISRFSNLISQFQVFYCSLQNVSLKTQIKSGTQKLLNSELSHDIFLYGLKKTLMSNIQQNKSNCSEEDIILKIQDMASGFYAKLWNSCTLEEKMILYDLARNSLINIKNSEVVRILKILMEKRLVISNDYFRIMNRSFKNYILTNANPLDLKEMDRLAKQNDAWQSFRIPLIIFASGIIIFLIATQQNFLSNLSTMLVSFGAIAGVFMKVSGIFSFKAFGSKNN